MRQMIFTFVVWITFGVAFIAVAADNSKEAVLSSGNESSIMGNQNTPIPNDMEGTINTDAKASGSAYSNGGLIGKSEKLLGSKSQAAEPHELSCPSSFNNDGVYIWCDPDGIWSVWGKGRSYYDLDISILSQSAITVLSPQYPNLTIAQNTPERLEISGMGGPSAGIVQFSSGSIDVEFEVLIDQAYSYDKIFIGREGNLPVAGTFSLQPRNDEVQAQTGVDFVDESVSSGVNPDQQIQTPFGVKSKPTNSQGSGGDGKRSDSGSNGEGR